MFVYHFFLMFIGGVLVISIYLTAKKSSHLVARYLIILTIWGLFAAALLPFIISYVHPLPSLILTLGLALGGGYLIFNLLGVKETGEDAPEILLPAVKEEQLLPVRLFKENSWNYEQEESKAAPKRVKNKRKILNGSAEVIELPGDTVVYEEGCSIKRQDATYKREVIALAPEEMSCSDLVKESFNAREEGNLSLSASLLREALSRADDISLKSLICTELTSLYKELGRYRDAVEMLEFFLTENYSKVSVNFLEHFKRQVLYLQTLDELLKKSEQPGLPFSSIPRVIKIKAEEVLKE